MIAEFAIIRDQEIKKQTFGHLMTSLSKDIALLSPMSNFLIVFSQAGVL